MPKLIGNLNHDYDQKLSILSHYFPELRSYKDVLDIQTATRADYIITYYPASLHNPSSGFEGKKIIYLGNRFNSEHYHSKKNLTDTSLIYISLGTVFNEKPALLKLLINYFSKTKYKVLVSAGYNEGIYNALQRFNIYNNIQVNNFVNQLDILKKSSLFITHAGFNSIYEGIYCSVPMLMIPHIPEQYFNAQKIEDLKSGYLLREEDISENYLTQVMKKLNVNWQNIKDNSNEIRKSLLESKDNNAVAKEIMWLIK
jgi:MGT family glycosyltransferase